MSQQRLNRYTLQGWRISERVERKSYEFSMPEWMKKAMKVG